MTNYLDFEKPLAEIEGKAEELRALARTNEEMDVADEAAALDRKAADLMVELYKDLTPWRKCQVARHPERPHTPVADRKEKPQTKGARSQSEGAQNACRQSVWGGWARQATLPRLCLTRLKEPGRQCLSRP